MDRELFAVKVKKNEQPTPEAWLLDFERTFPFEAGQVIGITIDPELQPRLYSIASGNLDKMVSILYTIKPDGLLTPPLSDCKAGDTIYVTHPFGNFVCPDQRAVFIATGTGIAPFASMIFSGQHKGKTLIQGNRNLEGIYFHQQFKDILGNNYHPCTSRQHAKDCFNGRVTDFIASLPQIETDIPYYLCGVAEMVVDVRDLLIERGVPFKRIMAEIFF